MRIIRLWNFLTRTGNKERSRKFIKKVARNWFA